MKLPVHIQFHDMEPSDALEASAREHAHRLESFAPDIMACHVRIDLEQKHKHQGRPFGVRIDLTLPGHELVVNRVQNEDVYVALRDAFDNMKRQLEDVVRKRRGQEKQHTLALHGELVRLDDAGGFGFIRTLATSITSAATTWRICRLNTCRLAAPCNSFPKWVVKDSRPSA
jgi:ribosomal subunit interface protein